MNPGWSAAREYREWNQEEAGEDQEGCGLKKLTP